MSRMGLAACAPWGPDRISGSIVMQITHKPALGWYCAALEIPLLTCEEMDVEH